MDFLDPKKKKAHKRQLFIGYGLMGIAILFAGVVLLYAAFGYGLDRQGNVIQNGLVYIASTPDGAEVQYTNKETGEAKKAVTADRLPIPAGQYDFEFLKEGYRPWQHTIEVHGGDVDRLVYPFLFPEELQTTDASLYSTQPAFSSVTPDRSRVIVAQPGKFGVLDIYRTDVPAEAAETISLPRGVFVEATGSLEPVEWSSDNVHVLMKHVYDGKTDFILGDIDDPANSINLDRLFEQEPVKVTLFDKQPDEFHLLLKNNRLLRARASDKSVERVLDNVLAYKSHGDNRLLYVTNKNSAKGMVSVYIRGDEVSHKIRELKQAPQYLLDLATHQNKWYVVMSATTNSEVFIYRDPSETFQAEDERRILWSRTLQIDKPQYISFSENTQFITAQNGTTFATYDAFEDTEYYFEFESKFDKGVGRAVWMDGHRLTSVKNGKVVVFDFDGTNYQTLSTIKAGTTPMFDRDYTRMLTIAPSVDVKGRFALTDTALRVE
jgi:hypothetical protein